MLNKIAEFILEKRLKEMENRISQLEKKLKDNAKRICEENRIPPIAKTPNKNNLIRFESTISFELMNGVKIIEHNIGSKSNPGWAVKEALKVIIPLAKDSGMTKQDFIDLVDKY